MSKLYALAECAEWYGWPPRFFWRRLLRFYDRRNPYVVGSDAYFRRERVMRIMPPFENGPLNKSQEAGEGER